MMELEHSSNYNAELQQNCVFVMKTVRSGDLLMCKNCYLVHACAVFPRWPGEGIDFRASSPDCLHPPLNAHWLAR